MKNVIRDIRYRAEYLILLVPYYLVRLLPHSFLSVLARAAAYVESLFPFHREVVEANIRCAMPELSAAEVRRIGLESVCNVFLNMLEFFWLRGNEKRIRQVCYIEENTLKHLKECAQKGIRVIFVNPHFGSWEVSGLMVPFYAEMPMAAIAKPVSNPLLNKLLNEGGREKMHGIEVIFTKGAVHSAITALKAGKSLGTLIDQNTRVRNGGVFVNFFGIPVPSSTGPAFLLRYCRKNDIPAELVYGISLRMPDGRFCGKMYPLPKKAVEYATDEEFLQDLMKMTEDKIRENPEQYLWMYRRFHFIPPDASDEVRQRYPAYARTAPPSFFRKVRADLQKEKKG